MRTGMTIVVLSFFSLEASARDGFLGRIKASLPQMAVGSEAAKLPKCHDMSGMWEGQCKDNRGEEESIKFSIDQQDNSMEIDGTFFHIHGTNPTGHSLLKESDTWTGYLTCRANDPRVMFLATGTFTNFENQTLVRVLMDSTMIRDGDKLTMKWKYKGIFQHIPSDRSVDLDGWQNCELERAAAPGQ